MNEAGKVSTEEIAAPSRSVARLRPRRLGLGIGIAALLAVSVPSLLWLGAKAGTIESELKAAERLLPSLQDELKRADFDAAGETAVRLQSHTHKARAAATDGLWVAAGVLPWAGPNFRAATEVATSAQDVAEVGIVPLVHIARSLDWTTLTPRNGTLDLESVKAAQSELSAAAHAVRQSSDRLDAIETGPLIPEISGPLIRTRDQLRSLRGGLDAAADTAALAPDMMGATTPRRYLLLIQNNAEARATGGIPGALAILNITEGKLTLTNQISATEFGTTNPAIAVEEEQKQIYSGRIGKFIQDVNLTPNFPTSASTARAMWEHKYNEQVDGAVSIDPVALSYLLKATGPIEVSALKPHGTVRMPSRLTSDNVVETLLSKVYFEIQSPAVQDLYFAAVAEKLFSAILTETTESRGVIEAITLGVKEGRILVWSSRAEEQAAISKYRLSGAVTGASISPAQFGIYFNDGTGAKMDYFVRRSVQLVHECPRDGYSKTKVRVTSTNTAPVDAASSFPSYVTGGGAFGVPAGTAQTNIVAYGPVQSHVDSVAADGKKISFAAQSHSGRPVGTVTVALPPGKSSTVEFLFDKIVQRTKPELAVTPTVQALKDVVLDPVVEECPPTSEPEG